MTENRELPQCSSPNTVITQLNEESVQEGPGGRAFSRLGGLYVQQADNILIWTMKRLETTSRLERCNWFVFS